AGGVVAAVGVDADEAEGVATGRHDREDGRYVEPVTGVGRDGDQQGVVEIHLEGLAAAGALGSAETEGIAAGGQVDRLPDGGRPPQEGDLAALRGVGAAGEG